MCCLVTTLLAVGPRLAILVWYLMQPVRVNAAFDSFIWGFLGWLFLPWTTLMYIAIAPGGILGFDWIFFGLGVFIDITTYIGAYRERQSVPYGDQIP